MTLLESCFLGLIQGLAEFLPISSSGHLSIFQNFLGITPAEDSSLFFDVLLHLGTLVSVCIVFRRDIAQIISECFDFLKKRRHPVPEEKRHYFGIRLLIMMFFASLPLFLVLPVQDLIGELYNSTVFIGIALIGTGTMLYVADRMPKGRHTEKDMRVRDALAIGVCQGIATLPGLSRSGTTISAGVVMGLEREFAVKFSFLISIPAVLGANFLSLLDAIREGVDKAMLPIYLAGTLVAMISGYFALNLVRYISRKGKFGWFAIYCWIAGVVTILLTILL